MNRSVTRRLALTGAGRRRKRGRGALRHPQRLGLLGLRVLGPGCRPQPRARAACGLHGRHACIVDGGALLHAARHRGVTTLREPDTRGETPGLRRAGARARLPAARRCGDRTSGTATRTATTTTGASAIAGISSPMRPVRFPVRDRPARVTIPVARQHIHVKGAGRGDPTCFTTQVFFSDLQEAANAGDWIFQGRPRDAPRPCWRGVAGAVRLRASAGLRPRHRAFDCCGPSAGVHCPAQPGCTVRTSVESAGRCGPAFVARAAMRG